MSVFDKFHYHEVKDRAFCFQETWEGQILDHPLVKGMYHLREDAERINLLIGQFYQNIQTVQDLWLPNDPDKEEDK